VHVPNFLLTHSRLTAGASFNRETRFTVLEVQRKKRRVGSLKRLLHLTKFPNPTVPHHHADGRCYSEPMSKRKSERPTGYPLFTKSTTVQKDMTEHVLRVNRPRCRGEPLSESQGKKERRQTSFLVGRPSLKKPNPLYRKKEIRKYAYGRG
jgi:hypothetical protein